MRWLRSLSKSPFKCSGDVMWWCLWISIVLLGLSLQLPIDTYVPLLPQIWRLDLHLFNTGREHPTVDSGIGSSPTVIKEALLLPQPRHRSTAMCFFPSNIAQRLAIRCQLIDSYFFSSIYALWRAGSTAVGVLCFGYERTGGHGLFSRDLSIVGFSTACPFPDNWCTT